MKNIVLILVFVMFSIYGFSQNALYGVRAGFNLSNLTFDETPADLDEGYRKGIAFGFFGEYYLSNEGFWFTPEVQFSAEGGKSEAFRIDYIQVPLLVKYELTGDIRIALGPQVGVKGHDYSNGLNNFAFSAVGGVEYGITREIFADARYSYGFSNVLDSADTDITAKNSNIQIGVGLKF